MSPGGTRLHRQAIPCKNPEIPRTGHVTWRLCMARQAVSGIFPETQQFKQNPRLIMQFKLYIM